MNKDIWTDCIRDDHVPAWPCPSCERPGLRILKRDSRTFLLEDDSGDFRTYHDKGVRRPYGNHGVFVAILRCSNPECQECVAVSGPRVSDHYKPTRDEDGVEQKMFIPQMFSPALPIIRIPKRCPKSVRAEIHRSFRVFWTDPRSTANHLRCAIELLLSHFKSPRSRINWNGKRIRISLVERIKNLPQQHGELREQLDAIRWLGNSGSHGGADFSHEDALLGFEILERILEQRFHEEDRRYRNVVRGIVRRKGPPKPKD